MLVIVGKKGTKQYGALIIEEVLKMKSEGKRNAEISQYFNLHRDAIRRLIQRYNKKQRRIANGITPQKKENPRPINPETLKGKDQLIKQLKMENELLHSFLSDTGRR